MANDNTVLPFKPVTSGVTKPITPSDHIAPNPAIVKLFEDFLKMAVAGKIQFAAVATVEEAAPPISTVAVADVAPPGPEIVAATFAPVFSVPVTPAPTIAVAMWRKRNSR